MVSVVAAVGATLVMEAIQSPRSPTDLSASPVDGSLAIGQNPFDMERTVVSSAKADDPPPVAGR
jgi:hypothetical protein